MPPRKRAGDLTGLETQRLQNEHAEELKARAAEMSMMTELEAEQRLEPVDYTSGPDVPAYKEDIAVGEVQLDNPTRTIMVNTTLEQTTFGAGKHYTFEEGRKYTVPKELADHLASKGLLWEGYSNR